MPFVLHSKPESVISPCVVNCWARQLRNFHLRAADTGQPSLFDGALRGSAQIWFVRAIIQHLALQGLFHSSFSVFQIEGLRDFLGEIPPVFCVQVFQASSRQCQGTTFVQHAGPNDVRNMRRYAGGGISGLGREHREV